MINKKVPAKATTQSAYEKSIYQFLSFFRFFSFAVAIALIFTFRKQPLDEWPELIIVGAVASYTILEIIFRFRLVQRNFLSYSILAGDLALCLLLVLATGGADSPFLLYSLLPTIRATFLFTFRTSIIMATLTSMNIVMAHIGLFKFGISFASILDGNYLSIIVIYVIFCYLIGLLAYRANLNVYYHLQSETIVEERRRLRREIHDGIAQIMGYLSTKTNLIKKSLPPSDEKLLAELEDLHKVTSESYIDIREAIDSLELEAKSFSLIASLKSHIEQFGKRTGIKVELTVPPRLLPLHPTTELQLLRIAQEALTNVRKHASATQIRVSLEDKPQSLELVVKDNGHGFPESERKGSGLGIMEERAKGINAILNVNSSPRQGVEVRVRVPRS